MSALPTIIIIINNNYKIIIIGVVDNLVDNSEVSRSDRKISGG
jgi:hypothetical protein